MSSIYTAGRTIASSTNATPIVVTTSAAHNLTTGMSVVVAGHAVNTNANGEWLITVVDPTHFSLTGSVGNGVGGATGTAYPWAATSNTLPSDGDPRNALSLNSVFQPILDSLGFLKMLPYANVLAEQLYLSGSGNDYAPQGTIFTLLVGIGGGGGGGGAAGGFTGTVASSYGGGGGGGAQLGVYITTPAIGANAYVVGAGGTAGTAGVASAGAGGSGGSGGATGYANSIVFPGATGGFGGVGAEGNGCGYMNGGGPSAPRTLPAGGGSQYRAAGVYGSATLGTFTMPQLVGPGLGGYGLCNYGGFFASGPQYGGTGGNLIASGVLTNNGGSGGFTGGVSGAYYGGGAGGGGGGGLGGGGFGGTGGTGNNAGTGSAGSTGQAGQGYGGGGGGGGAGGSGVTGGTSGAGGAGYGGLLYVVHFGKAV